MAPEKTSGAVFGSPSASTDVEPSQRRTSSSNTIRASKALRLSDLANDRIRSKCKFQFFKIENGAASPISDEQQQTGVLKGNAQMTVKVTDRPSTHRAK